MASAELLSVPLKKSADVNIVKPLKNLLQSTYNTTEHTEDFSDALNELSRLRTVAIWKVFDKTSLEVIYSYYDQLASLESKIPPQEVQIPFKWKDAFDRGSIFGGRMSLTVSSLAYERMCILFNMAALQSAIAAQQPLDTEDSLKMAAKLLQQSAGIFAYLKGNVMLAVHQETTPDLNPDTLGALSQLMLAQAQEVIAYKCIKDEMKESMVARVCAQAEELYTDALRQLQKQQFWERDWLPTVSAKQQAMRGLTQLYQGILCCNNKQIGEQIARHQFAIDQLKLAQSKLTTSSFISEQLTKASRLLQEANKDNDFIYHERIPDVKQLDPVGKAAVAKPLPLQDRYGQTKDLFENLVPLAVQQALSASAARKSELVSHEVAQLRDQTQLMDSILASLNLPACIESCPSGGALPDSIREKAAAVREQGGQSALKGLMESLPALLARNKEVLDETERLLREEEEADSALRQQFGARWSRTESRKLTEAFRANADKYRQIIDNAIQADSIVQQKYNQHKENIELLSGSEGDLSAGVPAAAASHAADSDSLNTLRQLMREVDALKSGRDALESELKDATVDLREQFLSALASSGAVDEPVISASAIGSTYTPIQRRIKESVTKQEELLEKIQRAHSTLMSSRGGADNRDAALARLCAAHDAYQQLSSNLNEGVKFYNDLTQLLVTFQNKVSDYCFARRTEKEELLKDLTQEASRAPPQPPQRPIHEPVVQRQEPHQPAPPSVAPLPNAPLPYPMQAQGMPLPYAAPGVAPYPYYAAPVPQMYNPYATLPYPHHAPRGAPPPQQYQPYQYPGPYNPYPQQ